MNKTAYQLGNGNFTGKAKLNAIEDLPYIADTTHIRVRKYWRYIFILVFILSKVFLATSIYFYLEYKHHQEQKTATMMMQTNK
jgi:hypothetical protein